MNSDIFGGFEGRPEAKAWILPDGTFNATNGVCHAEWLKRQPQVTARYGIDLAGLNPSADEQECRLRAVRAGFVRVRYDVNGGRLGIELSSQHFDFKHQRIKQPVRRAVIELVAGIATAVDNFRLHVMDDAGNAVVVSRQVLVGVDDEQKSLNLPLLPCPHRPRKSGERTRRG